jgi:hypothetical protein
VPFRISIGNIKDAHQGKHEQKGNGHTLEVFKKYISNISGMSQSMADGKNILLTVNLCK